MTERENALLVLQHKKPEWTPLSFDCLHHIGFAGGNECGLVTEDHRDIFGVKWAIEKDPTPDPNEPFMLEEIEDWRDVVKFPEPKTWDWEKIREAELEGYDGEKVLVWFSEQGLFDRIQTLGGTTNALCWLLTDPEECYEFFSRMADFKVELVECVAKYIKPDMFMYTDDLATKNSLFISPDTYRSLIKPHQERIIRAIRENGMIAEQHCCGKCDTIMGDFVEIGVEAFFPAQAVNDIVKIQKDYGDKLTVIGGYDSQGDPGRPDCSDESIINEAHRIIDSYADNGSFICMPMIMDTKINWAMYEPSHRQRLFRDEFYSYGKKNA
ncbi:MAG: uroporphyrinogen decarboxylase family protein [Lachnospiraceae bacterium]|nr:uroporphyrinogen decarboxylase family protein [Lachnospiraceae bacterium]